jgi:hypothetical protein
MSSSPKVCDFETGRFLGAKVYKTAEAGQLFVISQWPRITSPRQSPKLEGSFMLRLIILTT